MPSMAELDKLQVHPVANFLGELGVALAQFDWRTSSAGGLSRGRTHPQDRISRWQWVSGTSETAA